MDCGCVFFPSEWMMASLPEPDAGDFSALGKRIVSSLGHYLRVNPVVLHSIPVIGHLVLRVDVYACRFMHFTERWASTLCQIIEQIVQVLPLPLRSSWSTQVHRQEINTALSLKMSSARKKKDRILR